MSSTLDGVRTRSPIGAVDKPVPLADVAFEELRRDLLPGGSLFDSPRLVELELAGRLDMSRTPVREALHRLALIGILQAEPGGGYVPRRFSRREIHDHYQLRVLLEPMAAELAARLPARDRMMAADHPDLVSEERSADANTRFHKAVARLSGNRSLGRIIEQLVDKLSREGVYARGGAAEQEQLSAGHAHILTAIKDGSPAMAARLMGEHLALALEILLQADRPVTARQEITPKANRRSDENPLQSRERLGRGAYQELRAAILAGRLAPGSLLSESSVAQALNVSRTPTRYALRQLESEGYVDRDDRGRIVVHRLTRDELAELFAVRTKVEGQAARLAAAHISEEELERLDELLAADLAAVRGGKVERLSELNEQIHATVLRASRSRALIRVAGEVRERVYGFGFRAFAVGKRTDRRKFVADHAALVRAIRDGNGDEAAAVVELHTGAALRLLFDEVDRYTEHIAE